MNKKIFTVSLIFSALTFLSIQFGYRNAEKIIQKNDLVSNNNLTGRRFEHEESIEHRKADMRKLLQWQFLRLRDPKTNRIPADIRQKEIEFSKAVNERTARLNKENKVTATTWVPRGPNNQGGRTKGIAVDVADENIVIAGAAEGGIWRSTDKGATWSSTTDPSFVQNVDCLVQDTRQGKTNTWYYGTGELQDNIYPGGNGVGSLLGDGIYKSTDNGQTWTGLASTQVNMPNNTVSPYQIVWNIEVDTTIQNQDVVYAACFGGVYRSTNGGTTWDTSLVSPTGQFWEKPSYTSVTVTSGGDLYGALSTGNRTGIFHSTDGIQWTDITPNFWPAQVNRIVTASAKTNKNILYVFANTPGVGKAGGPNNGAGDYNSLWRYDASTSQWTDLSSKLPDWVGNVGGYSSQGGYDMVIKVSPANQNIILIGGTNIYISKDAFATKLDANNWVGGYAKANDISQYANHHPDQHALFFLPSDPKVVYSGHDGGVSRTNDITASNVTWTSLDENYVTSQFWSVSVDKSDANGSFIVGGMQDNGTMLNQSTQNLSDWQNVGSGDGTITAVADGASYYFASSQNGNIYRQDLSNAWTQITPSGATGFLFITPYILDPNNSKVVYLLAGNRVWRNSDITAIPNYQNDTTGINWSTMTDSANNTLSALAMSKASPNLLYVGTIDGKVYKISSAENTGSAFVDITGTNFPNAYITSIAVDPNDGNKLLVAFSNYNVLSLFSSTDGGANWSAVSGNLEENTDGSGRGPSFRNVKILPLNGSNLYFAGTSTGLYMTDNLNGTNTTWTLQSPNQIGNTLVETMDVSPDNGYVVAGTFGKGVFSASFNATAVKDKNSSPNNYSLAQNYPNPFNPSTTIEYNLNQAGNVSLRIFDSVGKLVETLQNGYENEGNHKVVFDSQNLALASGVYYYQIKTNNYNQTKKMVLLK